MSGRESAGVLTPFEAEHLVSRLRIFNLELIGSSEWMRQHEALEKLNIQAHHSAITKHDEFVVETIVSQQKMSVLVHELLAIEAWKEAVFPHLAPKLSPLAALKAYIVLYHEATLCNLFEVLLFHESACEAADEALAELVDYCVRKLVGLNCGKFTPSPPADVKKDLEEEGPKRLVRQAEDMNFNIAVCAVAMLRFITDHVASLPVSIVARLLDTHDVMQLLVPLVERPPWTRRTAKGVIEKFSEQKWVEKTGDEALKLTQTEGQVWLALYNLLMDNGCRSRYQYTSHRKEAVLKLRRHLNEPLMDQLPVLRPFLRMVEELALVDPPPPTQSPLVVIEQMSDMREQLTTGVDGPALAAGLIAGPFANNPAALQKDMKSLAGTYDLDNYEDVLDLPKCAAPGCGKDATQRCSRCKCEWYCGRECQVKAWKAHKAMCDVLAADAALKAKEKAKAAAVIEEID